MNIGHGSTKRERPKKAFDTSRDNHAKKLNFGDSSVSTGGVYRRKWNGAKSWLWTIVKVAVLVTILILIIMEIIKSWT